MVILLDKCPSSHKIVVTKAGMCEAVHNYRGYMVMDDKKTTTLYLMRHGKTEDNVRKIIQGQNDSPLTQDGIINIRKRARKLKGVVFDVVFCSDLGRAMNSLEILMDELNINTDINYCAELRELNFGQLTGENIKDVRDVILIHKKQTDRYYTDGESGDSFSKRVIGFVEMVLDGHRGETILFVTHYGVIETILGHYVRIPDNGLSTDNYDIGVLYFNKKGNKFKWV